MERLYLSLNFDTIFCRVCLYLIRDIHLEAIAYSGKLAHSAYFKLY